MICKACELIAKIEARTVERGCTQAEAETAARKLVELLIVMQGRQERKR